MNNVVLSKNADEVVQEAYRELSVYTAKTRSFPGMLDGLKTSYRRVLVQTEKYHSFTKSATLVGETMKTHVHGDASIYSVLINMTCRYNRFPLFIGKGNFGGLSFDASSSRYTEAYLNDVARLLYLDLLEYADYEDGEVGNIEPSYLPSLLPYCFLAGSSGMTVGLPTPNIPALAPIELIDFCISTLKNEPIVYPHLNVGKCISAIPKAEIDKILKYGTGKVTFKPIVIRESPTTFVVNEGTPGADIDRAVTKLQRLIDDDIISFVNESSQDGYRYVFIINNLSKISADSLQIKITNALTSTVTYRIIAERNGIVYHLGLEDMISCQIGYLEKCAVKKFKDLARKTEFRIKVQEAIVSIRDHGILSCIGDYSLDDLKSAIIGLGYSEDIASEVVSKPISYLTKEHYLEYEKLKTDFQEYVRHAEMPREYLLSQYQKLRKLVLAQMREYCTRTLSEDELISFADRKVVLEKNRLVCSKKGKSLGSSNSVILVAKNCDFYRFIVPMTEDLDFAISEDYEFVDFCNDCGKYLIVLYRDDLGNCYASADYTDSISLGGNCYIRLRKNDPNFFTPIAIISTDNDVVKFTNGRKVVDFDVAGNLHENRKRMPSLLKGKNLIFVN